MAKHRPAPGRPPPPVLTVRPVDGPFDDFYRHHAEPVRRALCLALADADLGTEAADEAMARAYERWSEVGRYGNPVGWVYRVGINWGRGRQRRTRWRDRRPVPERAVVPVPGDVELARALQRLTTEHRAVVVCRYYLDWSVDETAAALDVPAGTVKSRLARALDNLQRLLTDGQLEARR
jgi:RNA polymerase sigma-70 factor, ECF subfamily